MTDPGAHAALQARDEIETSLLYSSLQGAVEMAETIWNKAVTREMERRRKNRFRRDQYTADELFARRVIDIMGCSSDVLAEQVGRVAEEVAQDEREVAW
jgi:hypothetical protein